MYFNTLFFLNKSNIIYFCNISIKPKKNKNLINFILQKNKNKIKYFNFFLLYNFKKIKKFYFLNKIHFNKYFCFWPLFKQKNKTLFLFLKILNKLKNKVKLFKKKISFLLKKKKIFFLKKFYKKKKKSKSKMVNFHKRLIKVFWKSQSFFKLNFLPTKRYTTRKFKYKFLYWYKKNKKDKKNHLFKLNTILKNNFFFLSPTCLSNVYEYNIVLKNGSSNINYFTTIKINDTISFPLNLVEKIINFFIGKLKILKKFKYKNYIKIKNKLSQWKNIKKKPITGHDYLFFNTGKIKPQFEFDIFTAQLFLLKNLKKIDKFDEFNKRHNLEKLNTYKLNI